MQPHIHGQSKNIMVLMEQYRQVAMILADLVAHFSYETHIREHFSATIIAMKNSQICLDRLGLKRYHFLTLLFSYSTGLVYDYENILSFFSSYSLTLLLV